MTKQNKQKLGIIAVSILVTCVAGYLSRGYITKAVSYCKENVNTAYKNYTSYKSLKKFLTSETKPNSVLIFEPNPYHHECIPGYAKYFSDLGYNLDVLMIKGNEDSLDLFESKDKLRIFTFDDLEQINLTSNKISKKFSDYSSVLLHSTDPNKKELLEKLGLFSNPNSILIAHDINFVESMGASNKIESGQVLTLADIGRGVYVNPHYFGNIPEKPKNNKTRFFITSTQGRDYNHLVETALELKREKLDFDIVVTGRSNSFGPDSIPEELKENFIFKHNLSYKEMYNEIQNSDYVIISLDPENSNDSIFKEVRATGSIQLVYGFLKPAIIHKDFSKYYKLDSTNSFLHSGYDFKKAMRDAIKLNANEYKIKQENLKELSKNIYKISLENLKQTLKI